MISPFAIAVLKQAGVFNDVVALLNDPHGRDRLQAIAANLFKNGYNGRPLSPEEASTVSEVVALADGVERVAQEQLARDPIGHARVHNTLDRMLEAGQMTQEEYRAEKADLARYHPEPDNFIRTLADLPPEELARFGESNARRAKQEGLTPEHMRSP
jgi:hypothetical protein